MGSASAWWSCPHSRPPCVTALQLPGRQPEARLRAVPCSTSRSWQAANKGPAGLVDIRPLLPALPAPGPCICPALVPPGGATSTSDTDCAEEGTGPGTRGLSWPGFCPHITGNDEGE